MTPSKTRRRSSPCCLFAVALTWAALASFGASAQTMNMPFDPKKTVEQWGQVKYCQKAYAHPDNNTRVYGYDHQQCQDAESWVKGQLQPFPQDVKSELETMAQKSANRILANTRDITQVLESCRQTCSQMAARLKPGKASPEPKNESSPDTAKSSEARL